MHLVLISAIYSQSLINYIPVFFLSLGNLNNDDGDGNENGKKVLGLDWQNNNFARASRFFVHFFAVVARLQRESA